MRISYITFGAMPLWERGIDGSIDTLVELPAVEDLHDAVLMQLDHEHEKEALRYITSMRLHDSACLTPVFFVTEPSSHYLAALAEGCTADLGVIRVKMLEIAGRKSKVAASTLTIAPEYRFLAILFAFGRTLQPIANPGCPYLYQYPLAEIFLNGNEDSMRWVLGLEEKGFLEKEDLVDRVRHCPNCWAAQFNYLDICENCGSLRLEHTSFLHCFTCGHVERESEFLKDGRLTCPMCHTRLRNLGSDYDKTLESYICDDCKTRQVEPPVVARCLYCGKQSDPGILIPQEIMTMKLSPKAEQAVILGNVDVMMLELDVLKFIQFEVFKGILDWQLLLFKRYADWPFAVVAMRITNLAEQTGKVGAPRVMLMLSDLASRLRDLVRTTDICSRSDQTTMWFLLPRVTDEGSRIVANRIKELEKSVVLEDGSQFEFAVDLWFSASAGDLPENGLSLLTDMAASLEERF